MLGGTRKPTIIVRLEMGFILAHKVQFNILMMFSVNTNANAYYRKKGQKNSPNYGHYPKFYNLPPFVRASVGVTKKTFLEKLLLTFPRYVQTSIKEKNVGMLTYKDIWLSQS